MKAQNATTTDSTTTTDVTSETKVATTGPRRVTLGKVAQPQVKRDDIVVSLSLETPKATLISIGEGDRRDLMEATITGVSFRKVFRASIQKDSLGEAIDQVLVDVLGTRKDSKTEEILFEAKLAWGQDYDVPRSRASVDREARPDTLVVQTVGRHWTRSKTVKEGVDEKGNKSLRPFWNLDSNSIEVKEMISGYVVTHKSYGSPEFDEIVEAIQQNRTSETLRAEEKAAKAALEAQKISAAMGSGNPLATKGFSGNA